MFFWISTRRAERKKQFIASNELLCPALCPVYSLLRGQNNALTVGVTCVSSDADDYEGDRRGLVELVRKSPSQKEEDVRHD